MSEYYEVTEKDFERTEEEIMYDAFSGYDDYKNERGMDMGLESLFTPTQFCDEFREMRVWDKWFYWFKTFICLSIGRMTRYSYSDIPVVYFDEHYAGGEYCGTAWSTVAVGSGYFKNWYVGVYDDSSC